MQLLFSRLLKALTIFSFTFVMLFTTGCEDDDHDNDDHGHTDADGFILENESGTEVYREFEGAVTGSVTLSVGDTLELAVHFLDSDGNEIEHDEEEEEGEHEEGELEVSGSNDSIAIVEVEHEEEEGDDHDHDHDHEEEHGAALHIIGVSSGSTSFQLQLMHDGHADYTSTNDVTVTVN
tara:strand:- start:371 stop:907 length:537 start_codon:yes stop_codon:yes gene_type:complete